MCKCMLCDNINSKVRMYNINNVYTSNVIFEDTPCVDDSNSYGRGNSDIELVQCVECGFIFNSKFNFDEMIKAYSSDKYYQQKNFSNQLSKHIIETANIILSHIDNKKYSCIAEIASGQGDLLRALHKEVDYIYSIDPSPISNSIKGIDNIEHVQTFFDYDSMKNRITRKIDLIICRHVIEHMNNPGESLKDIIKLLDEDGIIYIEVPDIEEII
ncbi:TPA: class I SAM-dependent methyltransferase, partial [Campylobacter lari]|nr:class I SAM-dependent methyltransferase [Campylobacter lari]